MCYSKPGPRCAGHARATMERARNSYEAATLLADEVLGRDARTSDDVQFHDGQVEDLKAEFEAALREYETTPEGQRMLQESIDRLNAEGSPGARLAERRLQQARAVREQQVADHAASLEYGERLADLTPEEQQAVNTAERIYNQEIMAAVSDETIAEDAESQHAASADRYKAALDELSAARNASQDADQAYNEAVAGGDEQAISQASTLKQQRLVEIERARTLLDEAKMMTDHAGRSVEEARAHAEFSRQSADRAKVERDQTLALIGSGMGHNFRRLHLAQDHTPDMVMANPDGTLNVAKYDPPSDGFAYGRFQRASAVAQPVDAAAPHVLTFPDNTKSFASTNYGESPYPNEPENLVLLPPEPGAVRALPPQGSFHQQLNRAG